MSGPVARAGGAADRRDMVAVYGAGGHAKIVLATIEAEARYGIAGLLDDDAVKRGMVVHGHPVLGGRERLPQLRAQGVSLALVAIGDNRRRAALAELLVAGGFELVTAIHPTAVLLRGCRVGAGSVILVNAFIGADATVGMNAIVSVGAVVGHDSLIGQGAHLCPLTTIGGDVAIGHLTFIGAHASVLPGIKIGRGVVVGAGAVVTGDLPDGVTAVGVPARISKRRTVQT